MAQEGEVLVVELVIVGGSYSLRISGACYRGGMTFLGIAVGVVLVVAFDMLGF